MAADVPRLETYWFHETDWDNYEQLRKNFEWEIPNQFNIADYVCDRWAEDGDRIALYSEDEAGTERTYSYEELSRLTNQLAHTLQDAGVERGDRVAINLPQKPETVLSHIAAWKLGAVSIPLSTLFGSDGLEYRLDDSETKAIIVDGSNIETFRPIQDNVTSLEAVFTVDTKPKADEKALSEAIAGQPTTFESVATDPEETASILYTSGTTGEPKGVVYPHRILLGKLPFSLTCFCNLELGEDDVFWTPAEWAWVVVYGLIFAGLFYGRSALAYEGGKFDPEKTFELIDKYSITNAVIPTTALRMMMQIEDASDRYDVESMRVFSTGGEAVGNSVKQWASDVFGEATVHVAYGQTEMNGLIGECTKLVPSKEGTMGIPMPGREIRIRDPQSGEEVPTGDIGEITVTFEDDPVRFGGYLNKPEQTAEKVRDGWLYTEDLGVVDDDGYYTFHTRRDDLIISSGYRISPEEIEECLVQHERVEQAGVIGIPDDIRGEVPKAFISLIGNESGSENLAAELKQLSKDRLAQYEYPHQVEFLEQLPKTATGKIRRHELRQLEGLDE
jgi:acetyl-CoA synthetase